MSMSVCFLVEMAAAARRVGQLDMAMDKSKKTASIGPH